MSLFRLEELEADILFGIVNEKLRLECNSLDEVSSRYDIDKEELESKLENSGYYYDEDLNQLKRK